MFRQAINKFFCEASHSHSPTPTHSHSHSHLILDPGSAYYDDARGGFAPSIVIRVSGMCLNHADTVLLINLARHGTTRIKNKMARATRHGTETLHGGTICHGTVVK